MKSDEGAYSRAVAGMSPRATDEEHRAVMRAADAGAADVGIVLNLRAVRPTVQGSTCRTTPSGLKG